MLTDLNGRHRRDRHKYYRDIYYSIDQSDFRPYDILLTASRSFIGMGIRLFSMVNGQAAWLNHSGQVLLRGGNLVVSEASYPCHKFTPVIDYLKAQRKGKCRLTLMRFNKSVWRGDTITQEIAEKFCWNWHNAQTGIRYTTKALIPMALWSLIRNLTPFVRGRYDNIPNPEWSNIFICSLIVDYGWFLGQSLTHKDFFPSSLSRTIPSPQDIYESPYTRFIAGWRREMIKKGNDKI